MIKATCFHLVIIGLLFACTPKPSSIEDEQLLGDWQSLTNEQMQVSFVVTDSGQIYSNYSDGKCVSRAKWKLDGNKLVVTNALSQVEEMTISLLQDTLIFNDGEEHFVRLENTNDNGNDTVDQTYEVLDNINQNMGSKFTSIETFSEPGLLEAYQWKKMTCQIQANELTENYDQIITLLNLDGFEPDSTLKITQGFVYQFDNQKIVMRCNTQGEVSNDTVTLEVLCGTRQ